MEKRRASGKGRYEGRQSKYVMEYIINHASVSPLDNQGNTECPGDK